MRNLVCLLVFSLSVSAQTPKPTPIPSHNPQSLTLLSLTIASKTCESHSERNVWVVYRRDWNEVSCAKLNESGIFAMLDGELDMLLDVVDLHLTFGAKK